MNKQRTLFAALLLAAAAAAPSASFARGHVDVYVGPEPPPPREVEVPPPRHGYVWAPGYWRWEQRHHVWAKGHWERERHGMYWAPGHWVEREGRWAFVAPRWQRERFAYGTYGRGYAWRDNDGDGVPNRYDRAPNDPYRR